MVNCFARTYCMLRNKLGLVLDPVDGTPTDTNQDLVH